VPVAGKTVADAAAVAVPSAEGEPDDDGDLVGVAVAAEPLAEAERGVGVALEVAWTQPVALTVPGLVTLPTKDGAQTVHAEIEVLPVWFVVMPNGHGAGGVPWFTTDAQNSPAGQGVVAFVAPGGQYTPAGHARQAPRLAPPDAGA